MDGIGAFASIPGLEVSLGTILIAGMFLQTVGYFFLAFSHVLDVVVSRRFGPLLILFPIFAISTHERGDRPPQPLILLHPLRGPGDGLSYSKTRNPNTLMIAAGLGMLAAGWWVSLAAPDIGLLTLLQLIDEGSWTSRAIRPGLEILVQEARRDIECPSIEPRAR